MVITTSPLVKTYTLKEFWELPEPRDHSKLELIVIEIISPPNANYDRKTKSDTYQAMGVREMWLIDSQGKEIEVRSFEAQKTAVFHAGETLRSEVAPKIKISVSELFA
jgi:Uma2 family endonuclease